MKQRLASLCAEVSFPERNKFTAPLLLVHGLWAGSWMWRTIAPALALRGWECWALDLRGRPDSRPAARIGRVRLEDYVEDVSTAVRQLWAPPVVWGADLGALLVLQSAVQFPPRAVVCSTPLLPRSWLPDARPPLPLVRLPALPALLWSRPLSPPRPGIAREFLFSGLSAGLQAELGRQLIPDSGRVARTLSREAVAHVRPDCPALVVHGGADRMSAPAACQALVRELGADQHTYPDLGHWLYSGPPAPSLVGDVHRWIIRTLGEPLLVPPEDPEEED